jgi:hypothetical protein
MHSKYPISSIRPRRQRRTATTRRILSRALGLDEGIEACREENRLELVIEDMTRRPWQHRPWDQHLRLPCPLPSKRHPQYTSRQTTVANQIQPDFVNGLLSSVELALSLSESSIPELALRCTIGSCFPQVPSRVGHSAIPGQGIGLSLVAAIAHLHRFSLQIRDGGPGFDISIVCGDRSALAQTH